MKPTKPSTLITYGIASAIFSFFLTMAFVSRGFAVPTSPYSLSFTLAGIGLVLIALAIPMLRYRAELNAPKKVAKRLAPLFAFRVVIMAKSTSIVANLFLGWHIGQAAMLLTLPVITSSILYAIVGLSTSAFTLGVAIWVEYVYRIPPDRDEPTEGTPA